VNYEVNTEAYSSHCISRDIPDSNCNGSCQLGQELLNDENGDPSDKEALVVLEIPVFIFTATFPRLDFNSKLTHERCEQKRHPKSHSSPIFHPPNLV
jgi:hypothetical protein